MRTTHGHHVPYTMIDPQDPTLEVLPCGGPSSCDNCALFCIAYYHDTAQILPHLFADAKVGMEVKNALIVSPPRLPYKIVHIGDLSYEGLPVELCSGKPFSYIPGGSLPVKLCQYCRQVALL